MSIYFSYNDHFITLTGQTYPHRTAIKGLGARFQWHDKSWRLPFSQQNLAEVNTLCSQNGGGALASEEGDPPSQKPCLATQTTPTANSSDTPAPDSYTITEVLDLVEGVIHKSFPKSLWIVGEIQNFSHRTGHRIFFQVAEEAQKSRKGDTVTIAAVMWPDAVKRTQKRLAPEPISSILQDGLQVRLLCKVQFYKGRGNISLVVQEIDTKFTQGALALAREKLLAELRNSGLLEANKKTHLPSFPLQIGLVSAKNSRAESDFLDQLKGGRYCGTVLYCPAAMQGESAPKEVAEAVASLSSRCDLIVITRGGGSAADLRCFDHKDIALAIANCQVPVIAAIGHHDDTCIAEEACFLRQKTPTAAAEFILSCFHKLDKRLSELSQALGKTLDQTNRLAIEQHSALQARMKLVGVRAIVRHYEEYKRLSFQLERFETAALAKHLDRLREFDQQFKFAANTVLDRQSQHIETQTADFERSFGRQLEVQSQELTRIEQDLSRLDPIPWLKRGWTQLWKQDGTKTLGLCDVKADEKLTARLLDGSLELIVNAKHPDSLGTQQSKPKGDNR